MVESQIKNAAVKDYTKSKEWQSVDKKTRHSIVNAAGGVLLADNNSLLALMSVKDARFSTSSYGMSVDNLLLDYEERSKKDEKLNYERLAKSAILGHLGYKPMPMSSLEVLDANLFQPEFFSNNMVKNNGKAAVLDEQKLDGLKDKFNIIYEAGCEQAKKIIKALEQQGKVFDTNREACNAFDKLAQKKLAGKTGHEKL